MKNIDEIIHELIQLEPGLKGQEKQLRNIVSQLLSTRPDTKFDKEFALSLRNRLLAESKSITSPFWSMPRVFTAFGSALAVVLLVFFVTSRSGEQSLMQQQFSSAKDNAFGNLSINAVDSGDSVLETQSPKVLTSPSQEEFSAGSGVASAPDRMTMTVEGKGGGISGTDAPSPLIYPGYMTRQVFTYKGGDFELKSGKGEVYRRVKGSELGREFASQIKSLNFGLINLGSFGSMDIRNIEVSENRKNGYIISINSVEGNISVYPNYEQWESKTSQRAGKIQNSELIAIADEFIKERGINRSLYGEPVVQETPEYRIMTDTVSSDAPVSSSMPAYMPEIVSITYPMLIKGIPVYESGGYPYGLQISVSVVEKKVYSVYNLLTQHYESSSYELIDDREKILASVKTGGNQIDYPMDLKIRTINSTLGTPSEILLHHYSYSENGGQELFVPALMFPITSSESPDVYTKALIIPLVEGMTDIRPIPMPL